VSIATLRMLTEFFLIVYKLMVYVSLSSSVAVRRREARQ